VQHCDNPTLLCLLDPVLAQVRDGLALLRAGECLANGLGNRAAALRIGCKLVPNLLFQLTARDSPRLPASVNAGSSRRKFINFM